MHTHTHTHRLLRGRSEPIMIHEDQPLLLLTLKISNPRVLATHSLHVHTRTRLSTCHHCV